MARINIEDSLFRDRNYIKLLMHCGCDLKALGMVTSGWILAQKFWVEHKCIPVTEWPEEFNPLIECGLAKRTDSGDVYMRGSEKSFEWLVKKSDAGRAGGQASVKARRAKNGTAAPQKAQKSRSTTEAPPKHHQSTPNPLTPTLVPSPSPSPSLSLTPTLVPLVPDAQKAPRPRRSKPPDPNAQMRSEAWTAYERAYQERWKHPPTRNATVNSQIKALVERVGPEAPGLLEFFVRHNKPFYVEKGHPVGLAVTDYQGLLNQMRMNHQFTRADAQMLDVSTANAQTLRWIRENGV